MINSWTLFAKTLICVVDTYILHTLEFNVSAIRKSLIKTNICIPTYDYIALTVPW